MGNVLIAGYTLSADQSSVQISGTDDAADAGTVVQVFDNSLQVTQVTVDTSGNWTAAVATSPTGVDILTVQAAGQPDTNYALIVLRSASTNYLGYDPMALLVGSGDVLGLSSRYCTVTAGGNGQNSSTTDLIQHLGDGSTDNNQIAVLDNSRVDVWMDGFTATLGNSDNYGVVGAVENVVVNGAGDNVWMGGFVGTVNGWQSTGLNVTLLDNAQGNIDGNGIAISVGNSTNCGVYGTADTITVTGTGDNIWVGGNNWTTAATDFVSATQATGVVVNELANSRADVTGDGVTAYLSGYYDNFGIYGTAETVIDFATPAGSYEGNNIWIGGNGQNATATDQIYAGGSSQCLVTELDDSRVDISGTDIQARIGNQDNLGTYGLYQSVIATGVGDNIWIGGNGQNAAQADTVILQQGGAVHLLDGSWVEVSGAGAAVQLGANDSLDLAGTSEALTFGQTIGTTAISGFGTSDQITLQKSSFSGAGAGFDYWAYLLNHSATSGGDTTITIDATDSVVLKGVTLTAANQNQFSFA